MAQVPKDIQENIIELAKAVEIEPKELMNRLKEIMEEDENIQAMGEGETKEQKEKIKLFKVRFAWSVLYREYTTSGATSDFYFMPIKHANPREITVKGKPSYVGDIAGLVQKIENEGDDLVAGDIQYAAGTFWRKGAKNLKDLEPGKVYRTSLIANEQDWGLEITSDKANFVPVDYKMPKTFEEFYEEEINPRGVEIPLKDMDISESEFPTDIRVIEATVTDVIKGEKNGREYAFYTVMDPTIIGGNRTVFMDPRDVTYAQGSILKFGGTITIDENSEEPRWTPHFQLPTDMAMEQEIVIKPVDEEEAVSPEENTVDISEEEEEPKKEKEEKKDDSDEDENLFEI